MLCFRRGDRWDAPRGLTFGAWAEGELPGDQPTYDDLAYHLSTLFPPVRARGYLEVRYLDAQPGDGWIAPTLLLTALMSDPAVLGDVLAAAEPAAGRWFEAAREGLEDKLVRQAAEDVVELGARVLDRTGADTELIDEVATRLHRIVDETHGRRAS